MGTGLDGRLIFPGGRAELKPFKKEMKKLRANWVADVNWKYRKRVRLSAYQWADLADEAVEIFIASDTRTTLAFIAGLEFHQVQEDVYSLVKEASRTMAKYGIALYQPGGDGSRDPAEFEAEAEAILAPSKPPPPMASSRPPSSEPEIGPSLKSEVNHHCTTCGRELREEDQFCGSCGRPRGVVKEGTDDQSEVEARERERRRAGADERRKRKKAEKLAQAEKDKAAVARLAAKHAPSTYACGSCGEPGTTFYSWGGDSFSVFCDEHRNYEPRIAGLRTEKPEDPYLYDCYVCDEPGAGTQYWENSYYVIVCTDHLHEPIPAGREST